MQLPGRKKTPCTKLMRKVMEAMSRTMTMMEVVVAEDMVVVVILLKTVTMTVTKIDDAILPGTFWDVQNCTVVRHQGRGKSS